MKNSLSGQIIIFSLAALLCLCSVPGCASGTDTVTAEVNTVSESAEDLTASSENTSAYSDVSTENNVQEPDETFYEDYTEDISEDSPDGENTDENPKGADEYDFTVCFAGDINLDENWETTSYLDSVGGDIAECISLELIEIMNDADIMCLNNEFTYSTRGEALAGKAYTFRADPSRVSVLEDLGVDVVTLANNHVYDYGEEALLDTFDTLEDAGIEYFGAGKDLEEAMEPVYFEIDGKTVAFVGASRAEKYQLVTLQATESTPGILRCYDTELFLEVIEEARGNADFVIAFVHWGTEYSTVLEDVQLETGRLYLDAGCDAVIGAHSHCLQGMEYYDGKPIVYSLGNYWFNDKTLDTMLLELHFYGDDNEQHLELSVIPAVQSDCRTQIATSSDEQERIYDYIESISLNITIDDGGKVAEAS